MHTHTHAYTHACMYTVVTQRPRVDHGGFSIMLTKQKTRDAAAAAAAAGVKEPVLAFTAKTTADKVKARRDEEEKAKDKRR